MIVVTGTRNDKGTIKSTLRRDVICFFPNFFPELVPSIRYPFRLVRVAQFVILENLFLRYHWIDRDLEDCIRFVMFSYEFMDPVVR